MMMTMLQVLLSLLVIQLDPTSSSSSSSSGEGDDESGDDYDDDTASQGVIRVQSEPQKKGVRNSKTATTGKRQRHGRKQPTWQATKKKRKVK